MRLDTPVYEKQILETPKQNTAIIKLRKNHNLLTTGNKF